MKQPYEMTREEFESSFPRWAELSPRAKWRCYRVNSNISLREIGDTCSWSQWLSNMKDLRDFRWATEDMSLLIDDSHEYFIRQALQYDWDIPSDVLAEYPALVEEHINKRVKQRRAQQKRHEQRQKKKTEKSMSKADRDFWRNFQQ